jgi:hypothetical protein
MATGLARSRWGLSHTLGGRRQLGAGVGGSGLGWLLKNVRRLPTSVGQGLLRGGIRSVAGRRECHFKMQNFMY